LDISRRVEHLLLALIEYGRGPVGEAFFALDVSPTAAVQEIVGAGLGTDFVEQPRLLPYTAGGGHVVGLSLDEKRKFGHNYIGCEHLLLSLLRQLDDPWAEPEPASEFLERLGVDLRLLRDELLVRIPTGPLTDPSHGFRQLGQCAPI
jgi:ATP-dependent Clp protease ATP-binding subunit ClpC